MKFCWTCLGSKLVAIILWTGLAGSVQAAESAPGIQPFSTDGCSAFPDGTPADHERWQACCIAHDLGYWAGGDYADRLAVDEALAICVADAGESAIAKLMLAGVRVGGSPYFPTTYRWGYGWPYVRGYKALNDLEKEAVMRAIDAATPDAFVPRSPALYLQWVPWSKTGPSTEKP